MDRRQDVEVREEHQIGFLREIGSSTLVQGRDSSVRRRAVDPWVLQHGSRPSTRHCQPLEDAYAL